jgi:hypothetical protein
MIGMLQRESRLTDSAEVRRVTVEVVVLTSPSLLMVAASLRLVEVRAGGRATEGLDNIPSCRPGHPAGPADRA